MPLRNISKATSADYCLIRKTPFDWAGACWTEHGLAGFVFGRSSPQDAVADMTASLVAVLREPDSADATCFQRLLDVLGGRREDPLLDVRLDMSDYTEFQRLVVQACREIPRGCTATYGELAVQAGSPKAARAVGTVMAKNRFPLVVPCHRVVAANSLGGFSAPAGLSLKRRMLEMEGALSNAQANLQP